jgi:DNA (cytosine-5)-methyltransferase 1
VSLPDWDDHGHQDEEDMVNHPNRNKHHPHPSRNPSTEEIRAARDALGLTQQEAAKVVHSSLNAWQQWEQGVRRMHPAFWNLFQLKTKRTLKAAQASEEAAQAPEGETNGGQADP